MLNKSKTLKGYKLDSLDGEFGEVQEFYFDDVHWTIRYLVADTGNWLSGRRVMISPYALVAVIQEDHHIAIDLTKKQIEDSPSLNSDKPVSHQFEMDYAGYYGWPSYWGGPATWGAFPTPVHGQGPWAVPVVDEEDTSDSHLRSTITFTPLTARLAMSKILSSMMRPGRSVTWSLIPEIGGLAKRFWFHRSGSSA
jgi:hypothetical protein